MSMREYSQGKIYCIRNYISDDIYVGSTCEKLLSKRMVKHRRNFNNKRYENILLYQKMRELGVENFYIELHHHYPTETKDGLRAEEGKWIREIGALNQRIEKRDKQQYYQDKYEQIKENKKEKYKISCEDIKQRKRGYYKDNKQSITERNKNYCLLNHEKILLNKHEYYQNNRDDILRKAKEKRDMKSKEQRQNKETHLVKLLEEEPTKFFKCPCGQILMLINKNRHLKSKHHQNYKPND